MLGSSELCNSVNLEMDYGLSAVHPDEKSKTNKCVSTWCGDRILDNLDIGL